MKKEAMSRYGTGYRNSIHYMFIRVKVVAFLIDETQVQIGGSEAWLWVAVEPVHRVALGVYISRHKNMRIAEAFLRSLIQLTVNTLCIQMAVHGTRKHVTVWDWNIDCTHPMRRVSLNARWNISRTGQRISMIIFLV